jgi:ribosome-binding factor A
MESHKGELKRAMSRSIRIKFLPDLRFFLDPSVESGWNIEHIIKEVHDREGSSLRGDSIVDG